MSYWLNVAWSDRKSIESGLRPAKSMAVHVAMVYLKVPRLGG
jgi:hypothetical protein